MMHLAASHNRDRQQFPVRDRYRAESNRIGFTIAEVLVVIGIIGILLSLTAPAVLQSLERSRAITCRNNLRQIGLAAQSHEANHQCFPYTSTTWSNSGGNPPRRYHAISSHRYLMAHLDSTLFRQLDFNDPTDPGWLPQAPIFVSAAHRAVQQHRVPVFVCPSDSVPAGATSYRANLGVSCEVLPPSPTVEATSQRGAFVNGRAVFPSEFVDGLSHTALFSERVVGDLQPGRYDPFRDIFATGAVPIGTENLVHHCRTSASATPPFEFSFAGASWLLGGWLNTWYNHVLPPNSTIPDCGLGPGIGDGGRVVVTARSLHAGGVHVVMADGAVRFVANGIDAQIWRAMGTRDGRETMNLD